MEWRVYILSVVQCEWGTAGKAVVYHECPYFQNTSKKVDAWSCHSLDSYDTVPEILSNARIVHSTSPCTFAVLSA